jgi:hypothetical protein
MCSCWIFHFNILHFLCISVYVRAAYLGHLIRIDLRCLNSIF